MMIIEHRATGERQCVESLKGYRRREWRVLEEGVTHPRGHCRREGGRWRVDRDSHRRAELARLGGAAVAEMMLGRIAALEAKLSKEGD